MVQSNIMEIAAFAVLLVSYVVIWFLYRKKHLNFGILTLLATVFGIAIGAVFRENFTYVALPGRIFTGMLSAFVIPLLLFSVIASVTNLRDVVRLRSIGLRSVLHLVTQTAIASTLTVK
jgi:Na+/H+-dicarboxylate symporter